MKTTDICQQSGDLLIVAENCPLAGGARCGVWWSVTLCHISSADYSIKPAQRNPPTATINEGSFRKAKESEVKEKGGQYMY